MANTKVMSPTSDSATHSDLDDNTKDTRNTTSVEAASLVEAKSSSRWRKVVGFFWDSVEGDPEYRKYVQRLDTFFLCVIS